MAKGVPIHKLTRPDRPLRESTPVLMVRLNELMSWAEASHDPACVSELHNMRIAAKRLRYTLEIFSPTLGENVAPVLRTVEEIQERLGLIHDCDVLFPLLSSTLEREMRRERKRALRKGGSGPPPFLAAEGLCGLMARKRDERERLYNEFIVFWDALPPERLAADLSVLVGTATDGEHFPEANDKDESDYEVSREADTLPPTG